MSLISGRVSIGYSLTGCRGMGCPVCNSQHPAKALLAAEGLTRVMNASMACSSPGFPCFGLVPQVLLQGQISVNCLYNRSLLVEQKRQ